jgi:hypothetical protein
VIILNVIRLIEQGDARRRAPKAPLILAFGLINLACFAWTIIDNPRLKVEDLLGLRPVYPPAFLPSKEAVRVGAG